MTRILAVVGTLMAALIATAQATPLGAGVGWIQSAAQTEGMSVERVADIMRENGFEVENRRGWGRGSGDL